MAVIIGTNSYITPDEADSYLGESAWAGPWIDAGDDDRERALILAARALDRLQYLGSIASADQAMAWPRVGVVDREGRTIDSATVPPLVRTAQAELALAYLGDPSRNGDRDMRRVSIEGMSVEYDERDANPASLRPLPDLVWSLIARFLRDPSGMSAQIIV